MEILKCEKLNINEYKVKIDNIVYKLDANIVVKYNLLYKSELNKAELEIILEENTKLEAYSKALKKLNDKLYTEKELREFLLKNKYRKYIIDEVITKLQNYGYLNDCIYIETFIYDSINLKEIGKKKILSDLVKKGFSEEDVKFYLDKIEDKVFLDKIKKYIDKKLLFNKKSAQEFKKRMFEDLSSKGFGYEEIWEYLNTLDIKEDEKEVARIITRQYIKYKNNYEMDIVKLKIKDYLWSKGYKKIDIDKYINWD